MTTHAIAIQRPGWTVLQGRWHRALGSGIVLLLAALFIQPPASQAGVPAKADPVLYSMAQAHPSQTYSVIVREAQPASTAAEGLVRSLGGDVTRELRIVGGFSATVPGSAIAPLTSSAAVWRVWGDGRIHPLDSPTDRYDQVAANTVWQQTIGLSGAQKPGNYGAGVGVAYIDTGIVPVPDLVNRVTHVVDFTPDHDGLDRYGHGTHMAGIIAGEGLGNASYAGVAPKANLIPIKVASADGAADVSVVIAGLQWAVSHRTQYNIRVLNLSFGTDGTQRYSIDPLDYAVEQTWRSGILVVVSAGNRGPASGTINKPGDDPYVLTVGAADLKNTLSNTDDVVADFSSRGPTQDQFAKPDIVAPGVTIVSARDPGSYVDVNHPLARVGDSYFKGTGTSQAAAMVSGVAALMYGANPNLTPDMAKAVLMGTVKTSVSGPGAGTGLVKADEAVKMSTSNKYFSNPANQGLTPSTGTGSLEGSRGSAHVYADVANNGSPALVTGDVDVLGNSWSGNSWSGNSWSGNSWSANSWSNYAFEGNSWSGNSWSGNSWSGNSWSGMQWTANSWSANSWSGNSWSGNSWSGNSWSGNSWSGNSWSGNSWSGNSWSGNSWS